MLVLFSDAKHRVVDHTFISIDDLTTLVDKKRIQINPSHQIIILPILWRDHWIVAMFNFNNGHVEIHDSLPVD